MATASSDTELTVKIGNFVGEIGQDSFAATGNTTSKEVGTRLTIINFCLIMPKTISTGGIVEMACDGIVTNGQVTVTRTAQSDTGGSPATTDSQEFWYIFVGV